MGNSTSCTNANTDNLIGISLNEKFNSKTGRLESKFTFPSYNGCNSRQLELYMSDDGNSLTMKNSTYNTNLFGFTSSDTVSNNYVKENKIIKEIISSESNNNNNTNKVCLSYDMVIPLIIILLIVFYLK
jgi:hypothetical protein